MSRPIPPNIPRRRLPIAPVGREIAALTRKAFARFGFADDHVLRRWREIVGPDLAGLSAPERLSRPRGAGDKGTRGTGATLTVRVTGAAALDLQHMAPEIVARINGFYGRPVVARLKLVQGPLPGPSRVPAARDTGPGDTAPESPGGDGLEAALARLGRAVAADRARTR